MTNSRLAGYFGLALIILVVVAPAKAITGEGDFALRDGDTVVFLGDSITAARTYGKIIENYTVLRFPGRKVRFFNMGKGGETAESVLPRLEREVFRLKPTVLTVAYGINDIGWGAKADEEHKQRYLEGVRTIVGECKKRGVRVYICSAAVTGADPTKSENDFLQKMCDEGMALSRSLGGGSIDIQRVMRGIQKKVWLANEKAANPKDRSSLHAEDTIHLNDCGQIAMAYAMLKGLGAPAEVSSATIDAGKGIVAASEGCTISRLEKTGAGLEFFRLDGGLPLNLGLIGLLSYRFVPIPDDLNRYLLAIRALPEGRYEVVADGRLVGKYSSAELAAGVNLGSATPDAWEPGGPWDAQAAVLRSLTDARSELHTALRTGSFFLPDKTRLSSLEKDAATLDTQIERLQRKAAKPAPYHFVVRPEKR